MGNALISGLAPQNNLYVTEPVQAALDNNNNLGEPLCQIGVTNDPTPPRLTNQVSLNIRNPHKYNAQEVLAHLSEEDKEYLTDCLLSVISIGAQNENGEPVGKIAPYHAATGFSCDIRSVNSNTYNVRLTNVPSYAMQAADGNQATLQLDETAQSRFTSMLNSYLNHKAEAEKLYVRESDPVPEILQDADLHDREDHPLHKGVVFMGGGSISKEEEHYCEEIGTALAKQQATKDAEGDTQPRLIGITGGGDGVMKFPLKGIQAADVAPANKECLCFGYRDFIHDEPPHQYIDKLAVFSSVDVRLEAFFRAAKGMVFFPGGLGTVDEMLYVAALALKNKPENLPAIVFTSKAGNKEFLKTIVDFISNAVNKESADELHKRIIVDQKDEVVNTILSHTNQPQSQLLYNDNLVIPEELKVNQELKPAHIRKLESKLAKSFGPAHSADTDTRTTTQDKTTERLGHLRQLTQLLHLVSRKIKKLKDKGQTAQDLESNLRITLPVALKPHLEMLLAFMETNKRLKVSAHEFNQVLNWQ